ncbi:ISWI chromatin-remodeling complex ATPase ISW2 [Venturia nashicola]|nr:ISWI chromatin-remodeling complex ATPase ISW2 [Venturia nashicola]
MDTPPTHRLKLTASSLLSSFKPQQSPTSVTQARKMMSSAERDLRARAAPVSYIISDDSDDSPSPTSPSDASAFESPDKLKRDFRNRRLKKFEDDEDEEEEEEEEEEPASPLPENRSIEGGRSMRPRSVLKAVPTSGHIIFKKKKKRGKKQTTSQPVDKEARRAAMTARAKLRHDIEHGTKLQQDRFLLAHKDFFTPLLQENSYIQKLEAAHSSDEAPVFVPYQTITKQPKGINATVKPYQLRGLEFLVHLYRNGMSGILGDEMGLGKTLQTLSLFQFIKNEDAKHGPTGEARPFLVVCPLSVLSNWVAEAKKFTPGLKVLRFHGPIAERAAMKIVAKPTAISVRARKKMGNNVTLTSDLGSDGPYDIIVTTYEAYRAEVKWFKSAFVWRYLVLDEGHKIKNSETDVSKTLQGIKAEYRLLLTGTPLQNNLGEMWSLLHWLLPNVFPVNTKDLFTKSFDLTRGMVNKSVMDYARRLLELVMLRRMKDTPGVDLNLPTKTEVRLFLPLTPLQKQWYTRLLTKESETVLDEVFKGATEKEKAAICEATPELGLTPNSAAPGTPSSMGAADDGGVDSSFWQIGAETLGEPKGAKKSEWQRLLNLVMQLRKCCTHPYLIPDAAPDPSFIGDHIIQASGKFMALEIIVNELVLKQKKKILIFSNFTSVLDWTEDLLTHVSQGGNKFKHLRLDGQTKRARRNLHIRLFQDMGSEIKVMLISTKAGGLGLNLTAATEAVFLDEDWNPQVDLQAEARCHRIGQTKPVTIYKLCTQGTVEEQMLGRISKKLYLSARITDSMQSVHETSSRKKTNAKAEAEEQNAVLGNFSQLKSLLRRGAKTLIHKQIDLQEMASWDMKTLLQNTQDKSAEVLDGAEDADEDKWLSTMERVECAVFDGQRFERKGKQEQESLILEGVSKEDRRKGKNTTVMIDGYAVSKDTVGNSQWEAVATLAGKDPRLAEPKRAKKAEIVNQEWCQICQDGGELVLCNGCPRSFHPSCLGSAAGKAALKAWNYYCPQHICHDCSKKSSEVGDMIYRCRWCERGYCEDCLDWDGTTLLGDTLDEYQLLDHKPMEQAYYIVCANCNATEDLHEAFATTAADYKNQLAIKLSEESNDDDLPGLTDAPTTSFNSEVSTPADFGVPMLVMPKVVENLEIGMKKQEAFGATMKVDKTRLAVTTGTKKSKKKVDRMTSGSKRTFADLIDEIDEVDGGSKKKGRPSFGGQ